MNVLKNLRIEKELTQQQAAKLLGISLRSYITMKMMIQKRAQSSITI